MSIPTTEHIENSSKSSTEHNVRKTVESSRGSSKRTLEKISEQTIRTKYLSNVQNLNP